MNIFKYNIGDLVKMYDSQEYKMFFGYITESAYNEKRHVNIYEVCWFDGETSEYQPFSYHVEHELSGVSMG